MRESPIPRPLTDAERVRALRRLEATRALLESQHQVMLDLEGKLRGGRRVMGLWAPDDAWAAAERTAEERGADLLRAIEYGPDPRPTSRYPDGAPYWGSTNGPGAVRFRRRDRIQTLLALAQHLAEGGELDWRWNMPGDGSGLQQGRWRYTIELKSTPFQRLHNRLRADRGWGADR